MGIATGSQQFLSHRPAHHGFVRLRELKRVVIFCDSQIYSGVNVPAEAAKKERRRGEAFM